MKNQDSKSVQFVALTREAMKNVLGAVAPVSKQEMCEADHLRQCGVCDKEGVFTPCG